MPESWRELFERWGGAPRSQLTARELLEALIFWTKYPGNVSNCRQTLAAARERKTNGIIRDGTFLVLLRDNGRIPADFETDGDSEWFDKGACSYQRVPATQIGIHAGYGGSPELTFVVPGLEFGITLIELADLGKKIWKTLGWIACPSADGTNHVRIDEGYVRGTHKCAEKALCCELERRGVDSSAIERSGVIVRSICENRETGFLDSWPSWIYKELSGLHPRDQEAVREADRFLMCLRTQLEIEATKSQRVSEPDDATRQKQIDPQPKPNRTAHGKTDAGCSSWRDTTCDSIADATLQDSEQNAEAPWFHSHDESKPDQFYLGPLIGTAKAIDAAISTAPKKNKRCVELKMQGREGRLWIVQLQRRRYAAYFADPHSYKTAKQRLDDAKKPAQNASQQPRPKVRHKHT